MDVGTNKTRKDTRAVVSLVARYRSPNTFEYVEEACCDVSMGGMFIRSKDPAPAGTLLKLECESGSVGSATAGQIRGVARVVWLRTEQNEYGPSGMGVKFVKLDPESRDVITRIVQELAEAGIESPSMSSAPEQRGKPPTKRPEAAASVQPLAATQSSAPARASQAPVAPDAQLRAAGPSEAQLLATAPTQLAQPAATSSLRTSSAPPTPPRSSSKPPSNRPAADRAASVASKETAQAWRASDRSSDAGAAASSGRHAKSPPPPPPPSSSRPAPGAALARAGSTALATAPEDAARQQRGRDFATDAPELAPLQPVLRVARSSRSVPPPRDHSGRAFWLVAVAVVALSAIVAVFSMRATRDDAQGGQASNEVVPADQRSARASGQESAPQPTAAEAEREQAAADSLAAAPSDVGAAPAADSASARAEAAEPGDPAQGADPASQPSSAATPLSAANVATAPGSSPQPGATQAHADTAVGQPSAAASSGAQPSSTPGNGSAPNAQQGAAPATGSASAAQPAATPATAQPNAAPATGSASTAQTAAATGSASAAQPGAFGASSPNAAAQHASAPTQPSAANAQPSASTTSPSGSNPSQPSAASTAAAKPAPNPPPKLAPGEIAHIVTFTSRPSGASIFVGDQQITTPGEINLGAMPAKIRVTAQKEGYEPSTVWLNPTTEFVKVGGAMRREAHFVLKELPPPPAPGLAPAAPSSAPVPARPAPTAPAPSSAAPTPQPPSAPSPTSPTQSNLQPVASPAPTQAPSAPSPQP